MRKKNRGKYYIATLLAVKLASHTWNTQRHKSMSQRCADAPQGQDVPRRALSSTISSAHPLRVGVAQTQPEERQQQENDNNRKEGRNTRWVAGVPQTNAKKRKKTASEKVTEIRRVYVEPIYVCIRKEEERPSRARSAPQTDNNVK